MTSPTTLSTAPWQKTTWRGETCWRAQSGEMLAVVTEARTRLIYFGSPAGEANLLNAPYPQVLPNPQNPWPNQGGHRFWLGPQQRWVWPPLTEWEYSAATEVRTDAGVLALRHPQFDPAYPAIVREYAWENDLLRCTARWQDNGRTFYGMHVVAVDLPFQGTAHLVKTPELPLGLVDIALDGASVDGFLPHPSVSCNATHATLKGGAKVLKAGFAPQPLTIERPGGWQLSVRPGPYQGRAGESPDRSYLSQIWVGGPEHDLAELEQLTPYLRGDADGECSSTIFLAAVRPHAG